jgi:hypothetical protein
MSEKVLGTGDKGKGVLLLFVYFFKIGNAVLSLIK